MNAYNNRILESIELNEIDYLLGFVVEVHLVSQLR